MAIADQPTAVDLSGLDLSTRRALDAASLVRRPTLSLLAAMLPDAEPQAAFDSLGRLPFVELRADGLLVHDAVRDGVAAYLRASDPDRWHRYRIAAWRQLRDEVSRAGPSEMWRYTADLLYLFENPMIRGVYFPTVEQRYSVDGARPGDWPSIEALVRETASPATQLMVALWWHRDPMGFRIARDAECEIAGLQVGGLDSLPRSIIEADPVARRWHHHLRTHPVPPGRKVLFNRFDFTGRDETAADLVTAALMLDLMRRCMELRPDVRRIYSSHAAAVAGTPWEQLGFEPVPGWMVMVAGDMAYPAFLDFGTASVDGWLTRVIATELRFDEDQLLDFAQRQLVVDGRRVDLTKLEAEVLRCLVENPNHVVDRTTLLHEAWGYDDSRGSNVIEAQVKAIRHKLGDRAAAIETVRGIGYRFIPNVQSSSGDTTLPPV
jgi:DNA-binding winged helix-turn-helix (wHTH) protein